jgi:hypothetical protein
MGSNCVESWEILARAFLRTVGNCRKRSVWPVGAMSNMKERYLTYFRTSAKDIALSIPGICHISIY